MNLTNTSRNHEISAFEVFCLATGTIFVVIHSLYTTVELPYSSWFDQFHIVENYFRGSLSTQDLFTRYDEHGMLGTNIIFLLNVVFFKLTTFLDVYIGIFSFLLMAIMCVFGLKRLTRDNTSTIYKTCAALICFVVLSVMYQVAGGVETQICLGYLFSVVSFFLIDRSFFNYTSFFYKMVVAITIFISVNIFGTFYGIAAYPALLLLFVCGLFNPVKRVWSIILIVLCVSFAALYGYEYDFIGKQVMDSAKILQTMMACFRNPAIIVRSIFSANACAVLGYATFVSDIPRSVYLLCGLIMSSIQLYALISYFLYKMYRLSWLPVLFIGYSLGVLALIMLGESFGGWEELSQFRYQIHYKIGLVGIVMIFYAHQKRKPLRGGVFNLPKYALSFMSVCLIFGTGMTILRAPDVRMQCLTKQPYLFVTDKDVFAVPPDSKNGYNLVLMNKPETIMKAIELMRTHNLSVYKDNAYFQEYFKIPSSNNFYVTKGWYSDKWIGEEFEAVFDSGPEGKVELTCYFPKNHVTGEEKGTITFNDEAYTIKMQAGLFKLSYSVPPNKLIVLRIKNDFSYSSTSSSPDLRHLCFLIIGISVF